MQFSIIIPIYNSEEYLEETFLSIANQKFTDYEVIAVDDNSTDQSFSRAKSLLVELNINGKVLKKDRSEPNGVARSRNLAVENSSGYWLVFLDSDDVFHPEKLSIIARYLEKTPKISALCHDYLKFTADYMPNFGEFNEIEEIKLIQSTDLIMGNIICTSTVCVTREVFSSAGGFNENLNGVEDFYLWLKILRLTPFYKLGYELTHYRISENSLMGNRKLKYYVIQNHKLYKLARRECIFPVKELDVLYETLFAKNMIYYSANSIENRGYIDLVEGVINLFYLGHIRPACKILISRLRISLISILMSSNENGVTRL